MTFEPQTIETTDLLSTGTSKINDNFEAIAEEFVNITTEGVSDVVGDMLTGTQTGITVSYDDENNELDFVVAYGTEANTACQGNDARLSDARVPLTHSHSKTDLSDATSVPTASKIPIADESGRLDGWITPEITPDEKAALAGTLDAPSSDNPFATHADLEQMVIEVHADLLELNYQAIAYTPEITPDVIVSTQLSAHLAGLDTALQSIQSRLDAIEAALA